VLKCLKAPFFRPKALDDPLLNLQQIRLLMKEFRAEAPLLHVTQAEDEVLQLERDIDRAVYELYGLTDREVEIVEARTR
jgi:hypothetical protein